MHEINVDPLLHEVSDLLLNILAVKVHFRLIRGYLRIEIYSRDQVLLIGEKRI